MTSKFALTFKEGIFFCRLFVTDATSPNMRVLMGICFGGVCWIRSELLLTIHVSTPYDYNYVIENYFFITLNCSLYIVKRLHIKYVSIFITMRFEDKVEQLRIKKHKGRETPEFLADVKALTDGEAFEYLMGEVLFAGAKIDLSLRPMIPRSETEFWVKQIIEDIKNKKAEYILRCLDVFSGSGNVGIALLKNFPEAVVDMIEFDPKLKEQIEISIIKNNIKKTRTRVVIGDCFEGAQGMYDIITAVPPYVSLQAKDEVMKELKAENPLSFFDKEDGFYFHTKILTEAKKFLKPSGILYLETDNDQVEKVKGIALSNGWTISEVRNDPYGNPNLFVLTKIY